MMILQLLINITLSGLLYLMVASSFILIYYPSKFFNITHAAIIVISPYLLNFYLYKLETNLAFSLLLAITSAILLGLCTEILVFKPLRVKGSTKLVLLIVSLGLYIVIQNLISLLWGDQVVSFDFGEIKIGHEFLGAYITDMQIMIISISSLCFLLVIYFYNTTKIGRQIKAVSSNIELANIFGINSNSIIFWSFIIGSALAAVTGILVAFDTDMTPTMGFNLLLYGVVAMIIGGVGSTWGLIGGSLILATAQHLGAYYIDSKWMDAIAYIILILVLIVKPLGFSGKRLKKIEI